MKNINIIKNIQKANIKAYIMMFFLISIGIVFAILTKGIFLSPRNISLLARQTVIVGILAIGMMFVMVAGHIDLSVGSLLGFCGTLAAVLQVWHEWGTLSTILVVISVGLLLGFLQGFFIAKWQVPSFIITLGGLLIFRGMKLGLGKSMSIAPMNEHFSYFGQAYLSKLSSFIIGICAIVIVIIIVFSNRSSRKKYNFSLSPMCIDVLKIGSISLFILAIVGTMNVYKGIPVPVIILLGLSIIFSFLAKKTVFGRNVYAVGGNIEAARFSGIKIQRVTILVFILSGMLSALAGIVLTARLDAATVAAGDSMELDAIAACVVGGTSMSGGVGKISRVIIGALVMASLDNGMSLVNLENFWQFIVKGLVLIFAVWADTRK